MKTNASAIIFAYNHPSGNFKPNKEDSVVTLKMTATGILLELRVLDHLILTKEGYYSYADEDRLAMV